MSGSGITNHELKKRLGNVRYEDWIRLAKKQELTIILGGSGSHYTNIRDPKIPDPKAIKGLITTLTPNGCFKQANEKIFKSFMNYGISEDTIWKGLGLKK